MNTEPAAPSQPSSSASFLADGFHFYTQHLGGQQFGATTTTTTSAMEVGARMPSYPPPSYEESIEANRQYHLIASMGQQPQQQQQAWPASTSTSGAPTTTLTTLMDNNNDNVFGSSSTATSTNNNKHHHPMHHHHQTSSPEQSHQGGGKMKQRGATRGRKAKQAKMSQESCVMLSSHHHHHNHMDTLEGHNNNNNHNGNMRRVRRATTRLLLASNNNNNNNNLNPALGNKRADCALVDSMLMPTEPSAAGPSDRKYQSRHYLGLEDGEEEEEEEDEIATITNTEANEERMFDFERPKEEQHQAADAIIANMLNNNNNNNTEAVGGGGGGVVGGLQPAVEQEQLVESSAVVDSCLQAASAPSISTSTVYGNAKDINIVSDQMSANNNNTAPAIATSTSTSSTTGQSSYPGEPMDPAHYYYPGASLSTSSVAPVGPYQHHNHHHQHQQTRAQQQSPSSVPRNFGESSYGQPQPQSHHHNHHLHHVPQQPCSTVSPPSGSRAPQLGPDTQPLGGRRSPSSSSLVGRTALETQVSLGGECNNITNTNSAKTNRANNNSNVTKFCQGCRQSLRTSPEIVTVAGYHNWHLECLRCVQCDQMLCNAPTCHIYNGSIYCKPDYIRLTTCSGCARPIAHADWVRRAGAYVYHLACFACDLCKRQLSTGETFSLDPMGNEQVRLLCKTHFQTEESRKELLARERAAAAAAAAAASAAAEQVDNTGNAVAMSVAGTVNTSEVGQQQQGGSGGGCALSSIDRMIGDPLSVHSSGSVTSGLSVSSGAAASSSLGGGGGGGSSSAAMSSSTNSVTVSSTSKTKRVRTTFTEEQLSVLQSNFNVDSNPDGQDLERIAHATGLSKRVTQVWFQNSRARQKKYMNKSQRHAAAAAAAGLLGGPVPGGAGGPDMSMLLAGGGGGSGGGGGGGGGNMMGATGPVSDRGGCLGRGSSHMDLNGGAVLWSPTGSSAGGGVATGSNSNSSHSSSSSSSLACTEGTGSSSLCDLNLEHSMEHSGSMDMMMVGRDEHGVNN